MSMDIFQDLLAGPQQNHISAELLETLGKQAARRHLEDGANLNDTIRELISEHSGIQNEHTKRIAEFANNQVFQEMHSNGEDKNVHFEVADPGVIIRDLKDGGSPAHTGKTLSNGNAPSGDSHKHSVGDYGQAPESQGFSGVDSALAEHFRQDQNSGASGQGEPVAKTASAVDHSLHANPVEDVYDTHVRLRAAKDKLASVHEQWNLIYKQAEEDYYQAAKREVLGHGGAGMSGVIQATKIAAPNDSTAFKALKKVAERLVQEGVPGDELTKTASDRRILNPEHPLVLSFAGLVKAAEERNRSALALREVEQGMKKTAGFLKNL